MESKSQSAIDYESVLDDIPEYLGFHKRSGSDNSPYYYHHVPKKSSDGRGSWLYRSSYRQDLEISKGFSSGLYFEKAYSLIIRKLVDLSKLELSGDDDVELGEDQQDDEGITVELATLVSRVLLDLSRRNVSPPQIVTVGRHALALVWRASSTTSYVTFSIDHVQKMAIDASISRRVDGKLHYISDGIGRVYGIISSD